MLADIRPALRSYILADAGIVALVGVRVYPARLPQGIVDPSIVLTRISGFGIGSMAGDTGLTRPRMQIDCWSLSADIANTVANGVKERISGFRGRIPYGNNSPATAVQVQGIFFESERDVYEQDTKLYGVSRDYFVWYEER